LGQHICSPQTFSNFPSTVEKEKVKTPRREKEKKERNPWAVGPTPSRPIAPGEASQLCQCRAIAVCVKAVPAWAPLDGSRAPARDRSRSPQATVGCVAGSPCHHCHRPLVPTVPPLAYTARLHGHASCLWCAALLSRNQTSQESTASSPLNSAPAAS